MFGWKEICVILPVILAWLKYCDRNRYYANLIYLFTKINDLIEKIWSKFWGNRTKCLGVVFLLAMVALTSFLLRDTHKWIAIWIASIAIFAVLGYSYKVGVEMRRAQLTSTLHYDNRAQLTPTLHYVNWRNYPVLENQVISIQRRYVVRRIGNTRNLAFELVSMDVENLIVVDSNVPEVVQRDVENQSVAHANVSEVAEHRDVENLSVAEANVPEVAIQGDVTDQFVAIQGDVENQSIAHANVPEVAEQRDVENLSTTEANVPEVAIQGDVTDQFVAIQGGVVQRDVENQSVAHVNVPKLAEQRDVENLSFVEANVPEVYDEKQSYGDANGPEVSVPEDQSVAGADRIELVHIDDVGKESYSDPDADPPKVVQRDDAVHQLYADADPLKVVHCKQSYADPNVLQVAVEGC